LDRGEENQTTVHFSGCLSTSRDTSCSRATRPGARAGARGQVIQQLPRLLGRRSRRRHLISQALNGSMQKVSWQSNLKSFCREPPREMELEAQLCLSLAAWLTCVAYAKPEEAIH